MSKSAAFEGALSVEIHVATHLGFVAGMLGFVIVVSIIIPIFLLIVIYIIIHWFWCGLSRWAELVFDCMRYLHFRLCHPGEV